MRALLVAIAAAASTCVGITAAQVAVAPPAAAAPVLAPTIDPFDKTSVSDAYKASLAAAREVPVGWTGNVATCTKGTETQASQDATASAVNFFRAMNGLPPITMDPALHSQALAAALMMDAANDLNHTPDMGWPCYTAEGDTGAGAGSLSQAPAARAIESYMVDPGDKNFFAGHRRQILYPPSTTFGTGSTTDYNSLPYGAFGARPSGVNWIAWPSAGYVPKSLVTGRFSLSSNVNPDADYSAATVSVKVAGSSLPVTVHPQVDNYGDNTLTWEVTLPAGFATTPGDVKFDITVSGMKTHAGAAIPQRVYSSWAFTGLPGEATNLNASYDGTFATLSWNHPGFDGGGTITGYRITPYINGVAQPSGVYGNANVQIFGGLVKGASYTWKVQAINSAGTGAQSAASNAISTGAGSSVPAAATGVIAVAGNAEATVSWTAPLATGGSAITGYLITPYIGATAQTTTFSSGTGTSKLVTGLTNGTTYTFRVYAFNASGNSVNSDPSNAVTPAAVATVPGAPTGVSATGGDAQATVSWTAPGSNGGSAITGYKVTPFIGAVAQPTQTFNSTATSQSVAGLTNGTAYTFKVAAVNAVGTGAQSAASNAVTPATVPGAPTGVSATGGNAQATVSWTAPASNGGSAITGYKVTPFIGGVAQPTQTFNSTATSQSVTGLTNGTAYTFKVAAVNAKGTGPQSAASNAVTPTGPSIPYAPFGSWAAFVNRQYVDLTTKAPSASSLASWVSQLDSGAKTKGDLDDALRRGTENLANVDPVVRIYRAFLGRAPDAGGLKFWINRKRAVAPARTWNVTQIATEFTKSNEFVTKYGGLTNRQWVTQIYTDVLGRTADQAGVDFWTKQLDTNRKTKAQVMVGFSESNEYKTKQAQNTDVAVAYIYLMGRAPTSGEAADWVTRQKAGTTHVALLTELLQSAKYATHITG